MSTFLTSLLLFTGLLLVISVPVLVVARQRGRAGTVRRFPIAAVVTALFCATLAATAVGLEERCEAAGNPNCFDSGATGLQTLAVVVFAGIAWVNAYMIYRD
jgi:hypothetical protein